METDQTRATQEVSALRRDVEAQLRRPAMLGHLPDGLWRRQADLCLVSMPSFDRWASWSVTRASDSDAVLIRRVSWDQMKDASELWDPIRRLKYVGRTLEPSVSADDAVAPGAILAEAFDQLRRVQLALLAPDDFFTIDGTRRQLLIHSGQWNLDLSWTSLPASLEPLEAWWEALCDELDEAVSASQAGST